MRRISAGRLAGTALMAVIATAGVFSGPAAQAAPTAAISSAAAVATPTGFTDPCPPSGPDNVSCAALISTPAARSAGAAAAQPAATTTTPPAGLSPANLQQAYDLQSATGGSGQTVALVTAYDDPTAAGDLAAYRTQYSLAACTVADGCFKKVGQTGSTTSLPGTSAEWTAPVAESLDAISAICPNCHILLVEANSAATADLAAAENEATVIGARFITNDWTGPESASETTYDSSFSPDVVITAPAGDAGYGATYPAASPNVIAVGGTTLTASSGSPRGYTEAAWADTGSGCSAYEPKPSWQTDTGCAGRTMNDLAADAGTPIAYYDTSSAGGWGQGEGTLISSAIVAAAYALAGTPAAGTHPASYPYQHPGGGYTTPGTAYPFSDGLNSITSGSDGTCSVSYLCTAGAGYNGPAGLGTPAGTVSLTGAGGQPGVIYSGMSDKCLDDERGATAPGTHVQIYDCNGGTTQDWTAEPDGTVRFGTANCMADSGTTTTGGYHLVDLQPCDTASPAMQWTPLSDGYLYNPATGWCLTDPGASTANSTQVVIGACHTPTATTAPDPSQQWTIPYTRTAVPGAIQSKVTAAKLCISDSGTVTTNGNPIQIWQCISDAAQNDWTVAPDGTLQFQGKCAVPQNGGITDSTPIVLWTCEGEATQFWTERSDGSFVNKVSGICLTDPNGSTTNGTKLYLLHCNGAAAEGWTPHYPS